MIFFIFKYKRERKKYYNTHSHTYQHGVLPIRFKCQWHWVDRSRLPTCCLSYGQQQQQHMVDNFSFFFNFEFRFSHLDHEPQVIVLCSACVHLRAWQRVNVYVCVCVYVFMLIYFFCFFKFVGVFFAWWQLVFVVDSKWLSDTFKTANSVLLLLLFFFVFLFDCMYKCLYVYMCACVCMFIYLYIFCFVTLTNLFITQL